MEPTTSVLCFPDFPQSYWDKYGRGGRVTEKRPCFIQTTAQQLPKRRQMVPRDGWIFRLGRIFLSLQRRDCRIPARRGSGGVHLCPTQSLSSQTLFCLEGKAAKFDCVWPKKMISTTSGLSKSIFPSSPLHERWYMGHFYGASNGAGKPSWTWWRLELWS